MSDIRLRGIQRRILQVMADGEQRYAYGLALELGSNEDTVHSGLKALVKRGLIEQSGHQRTSRGPARAYYRLTSVGHEYKTTHSNTDERDDEIRQIAAEMMKLSKRLGALVKK